MSLDHNPRSDTSRMAAQDNRPRRPLDRHRAYRALVHAGAQGRTDFELADEMSRDGYGSISQTSAGKRRLDLVQLGVVVRLVRVDPTTGEFVGVRRPSPSGASASVWIAIEHDPHPF